jgi:hypothetical protein
MGDVSDGLSNTIFVIERSSDHAPATWTGAVTGARVPAWMANFPPTPYIPPAPPPADPGPPYDNADYDEALVLSHGNASHVPSSDVPFWDPDTSYSMHTPRGANFLMGDCSVRFFSVSIDPTTYQALTTIAGNELAIDF